MEPSQNPESQSWAASAGTNINTQSTTYPFSSVEDRGSLHTASLIDHDWADVSLTTREATLLAPTAGSSSHTNTTSSASPPIDTYSTSSTVSLSTSKSEPSHKVQKRKRNTEAARRYRQRKEDKTSGLEAALKAMTQERDQLSLKLARAEAEASVLRSLVVEP